MALIDDGSEFGRRVRGRLETEEVVWLTTVDRGDRPQPVPVWFLWTDDELLMFSQPDRPKLANMARRPRVAVNFNSDVLGGDVVVLIGVARLDDVAPTEDELGAYDAKYGESIRRLGSNPEQFHSEYSVAFRVKPSKLRGF